MDAITQSGPAGRRGAIAAVPAAGSLVLVGLLMTNTPILRTIIEPAVYLCAGLWVLATFILAPVNPTGRSQLGLLAVVVYGLAFLLPAAALNGSSHEPVMGYLAYAAGPLVVPLAWLANPLFLLGLVAYRQRNHGAAIALSAIGVLLALSVLITLRDITPSIGFVAWAGAMGILTLGAATEPKPAAAPQPVLAV